MPADNVGMGTSTLISVQNERGQGLIQVLIAVVLMGVIASGFATIVSNMSNAQRDAQARADLTSLTQELQTNFSSPIACAAGIVPGTAFNSTQAAVKYPPASGTFQNNGMPFAFKLGGDTLQTGQTMKNYSLVANRIQFVNSTNIGNDTNGDPIYRGDVIGQFAQKTGNKNFGTRNLASGYITVKNGVVVGCSTAAPPSLDQASANCAVLGGTYDTTVKKCLTTPNLNDPQTLSTLCTNMGGTFGSGSCTLRAPASDMNMDASAIAQAVCPQFGGSYTDGKCQLSATSGGGGSGTTTVAGQCLGPKPSCSGTCSNGPGVKCTYLGAAPLCTAVASTGSHTCSSTCMSSGQWSPCQ